ncbi:TA system antitoxin ParD family protein [Marinobacter changyiensis]|uniref:TA system antitoxin ParD family protein n=1 Tax=Marinobacter changyiensis TaxID=2604091 RepID=UPI001264BB65|nr:hypothetical protein [Marinobacter changyiensis]
MSIPVRLDEMLVRHAAAEGQVQRRSVPKQIELWAEIGRSIANEVNAEDLMALTQGLKKVRVERVEPEPLESENLWAEVDQARDSGRLGKDIKRNRTVYQASTTHAGYLEALYPNGSRAIGRFVNGTFEKLYDRDDAA